MVEKSDSDGTVCGCGMELRTGQDGQRAMVFVSSCHECLRGCYNSKNFCEDSCLEESVVFDILTAFGERFCRRVLLCTLLESVKAGPYKPKPCPWANGRGIFRKRPK